MALNLSKYYYINIAVCHGVPKVKAIEVNPKSTEVKMLEKLFPAAIAIISLSSYTKRKKKKLEAEVASLFLTTATSFIP